MHGFVIKLRKLTLGPLSPKKPAEDFYKINYLGQFYAFMLQQLHAKIRKV